MKYYPSYFHALVSPQPHIAALLQLARKPKARDARRLGDTPGVVAGCGLRDTSIAQRGAHRA